jgi:FKBP-type peptidyl-prolyl cis-trans isomerase
MKSKSLFVTSLFALAATLPLVGQEDVRFNLPGATSPAAAPAAAAAAQTYTEAQLLEMFGWFLGQRAGLPELEFSAREVESVVKGLQIAARGQNAPYNLESIGPAMERFMSEKQGKFMEKLRQQGLAESQAFLSQIRNKAGVTSTPSGLAYEILQPGTGRRAGPTDTVRVHYSGSFVNGTVFDSSIGGDPVDVELDSVLPGWAEGMQLVNTGGKIRLYVPPQLAYGDEGAPGIPPASTLIFEVELLAVNPPPATPAPAAATPAPPPAKK